LRRPDTLSPPLLQANQRLTDTASTRDRPSFGYRCPPGALLQGLNSLMANSVKLGGDASVAAGPIGAGANADITADLIAFSRSKGVYGGLNLNGTVVSVADNWNQAYYGRTVTPPDILMTATAHNPSADQLGDAISRAAGGAKTSLR